jgi:hypothetical protein
MVLRIASITALALATACGAARAQMAPAFQAPPPVFVTTIRAQMFCGEAGRCPQRIYRTVFQTLPNGDVYATDSGLTYPLNRTEVLTQPPPAWATVPPPPPLQLERLFGPADLNGATEWVVASTFAGNVLSLFYTSEAYRARSRFKMRLRFHHGTRVCEVLAWEHGGQSGRYPLAQAYIDGKCEIPPPSVAVTARPRVQKAKPAAKVKEPACVAEPDTPCPALK